MITIRFLREPLRNFCYSEPQIKCKKNHEKKFHNKIYLLITFFFIALSLIAQDLTKENQNKSSKITVQAQNDVNKSAGISGKCNFNSVNPKVAEVISEINKDSIYNTINQLCSFGTRSVYAGNRREVAAWTVAKFISFGYSDVAIDSFRIINKYTPYDSIWEYNVSAKLPGTSSASEVYLVTSHPDTYTANTDPRLLAPGANDDGSGMAGMIEIARVLKKADLHPFATIRFSTLSSEEIHMEGASHYVIDAIRNNENIRLMLSMDMIAYTNSLSYPVGVYQVKYNPSYWSGDLIKQSIQTYSSSSLVPDLGLHYGGNEIPFLENGFCVGNIIQTDFNNRIHTIHDSVQYLNLDMCRDVTVAFCAALLNENYVPVPYNVTAQADKERIGIFWQGRKNATIQGYNIYRSNSGDSGFMRINTSIFTDTMFYDYAASPGINYYYRISSVNTDNFESTLSNPVNSFRMTLDKELLVIKDAKGTIYDPADSLVIGYYKNVFQGMTYDFTDASDTGMLDPGILGHYKRVVWLSSNIYQLQSASAFIENRSGVLSYLKNNGNLLLVCPQPTYLIASNTTFIKDFLPGEDIYNIFKIKKVNRVLNAMFSGAVPASTGYDSICVDPAKAFTGFPLHIKNVETIEASPRANIIYLFDTKYDTTTTYGKMKGKPIGLEYLGTDYKIVILSCPLYYMDSLQARTFVQHVITNKFPPSAGFDEKSVDSGKLIVYQNYPNPVIEKTTIPYYISGKSRVSFELINYLGEKVQYIQKQKEESGYNNFKIRCSGYTGGLYLGVIRAGKKTATIRIVVVR